MVVSIIAALGSNRAIGKDNALLWNLPGDLPRFKQLTMGHPVIMGRKTYESIGSPLPGRLNVVVTRNRGYRTEGAMLCHSLDEALAAAAAAQPTPDEIFVIGGADIYSQTIDRADRLYLTEVDDAPVGADAFFPDFTAFSLVQSCEEHTSENLSFRFTVRTRLVVPTIRPSLHRC